MNKCILSFVLLLSIFSTQSYAKPTPGDFSHYILSMSHMNDFCDYKPEKKECREGAGSAGMVLHGLWPNRDNDPSHNYQYCEKSSRETQNWCAPEIDITNKIDPQVLDGLREVMPGVASCLQNHEWYAHGSCSGLSTQDYFMESQELARKFRTTSFNAWLKEQGGKQVSLDAIYSALMKDFGTSIRQSIAVQCRSIKRKSYFTELHIALGKDNLRDFPAEDSFTGLREKSGDCPRDGIFITH